VKRTFGNRGGEFGHNEESFFDAAHPALVVGALDYSHAQH